MSTGVIVTGSTGFIGKHLVDYLKSTNNYKVIAAARRAVTTTQDDNISYFNFSLDDCSSIQNLFNKNQDSQVVIHLAAIMDFHPCNKDLVERMRQINIDSSVLMFKEFLDSKEKKVFIYASTQAAMGYSKQSETPMNETSICEPTFEYGKSKLETEKKLQQMMNEYMLTYKSPKHLFILRLTGVTGKDDTYAAFEMIQASAFGLNSIVYPGDCTKGAVSFVHVSDVCKGIELCIEKALENNNSSSNLYIIGPRKSISMKEAIDCTCEATGWPKPLFSVPLPWFRFLVKAVSPIINWARSTFFGFGRASFLFAPETIDCMEQNHSFSSEKAMRELGYNPMTTKEAFLQSISEHSNRIPSSRTIKIFQFSCLLFAIYLIAMISRNFLKT